MFEESSSLTTVGHGKAKILELGWLTKGTRRNDGREVNRALWLAPQCLTELEATRGRQATIYRLQCAREACTMNDGPDGFERRKPDGLAGVTSLPVAQCDSPGWAYSAT